MARNKIIGSLILVGALIASFIIITRSPAKPKGNIALENNFSKNTNTNLSFKRGSLSASALSALNSGNTPQKTTNLTDLLAENYAYQIFKNNPDGVKSINGSQQIKIPQNLTPDEAALSNQLATALTFTSYTKQDIKNSSDNSIQAQITYLDSLDTAIKKNFGSFKGSIITALDSFFEKNNSRELQFLVTTIPVHLDDLLKISVPPHFVTTHIDILNLWSKKLALYSALLNYPTDPLKGTLALQEIESVIQKDLDLQTALIKEYQSLKS